MQTQHMLTAQGLQHTTAVFTCSRLLSSLSALYALNISIATSTDRLRVLALVRPAGG
jgi:hypothetical protein